MDISSYINSIIIVSGTLLGVYIGSKLNETTSRRMKEKDEKRQIESIRTLISLEIDQNLESLKNLWNKLKENSEDNDSLSLAQKLVKIPLPNFKHVIWEKQTSLLTISFEKEEIKNIYSIYSALDDLNLIYHKLNFLIIEEKQKTKSGVHKVSRVEEMMSWMSKSSFEVDTPVLWLDFEEKTQKLIKNGNPLKIYCNNNNFCDDKFCETDKTQKEILKKVEDHYKN